ncbi:MAG: acyltransferase domain-containing protein, partial [Acetobacteraceae bacterium]|nr:acyltransferase domain-containing protein [Acetobacteraceae bacterium]
SAAFRAGVAAADAALAPLLGWSVADCLGAGVAAEALAATDIAQPLLFAIQHGIVAVLAAEGIRPAFCLGHSVGEVAAAAASGLLDLGAAARLIVTRSRHQHAMRGQGGMAALGATPEEAAPVLAECGPGLEVAALNGPRALTVAGPKPALARLAAAAAERQWACMPLDLDYAFHSAFMDPVQAPLLADLAGLATAEPAIPMISSVTGAVLEAGQGGPDYWWRNLREPVRFRDAVCAAAGAGAGLFIEIGPNPALQSYLRETLREMGAAGAALPSLTRREAEACTAAADPFAAIADRAFAHGADPRGGPAYAGPATRRGLPATPFARTPLWWTPSPEAVPLTAPVAEHPLLGFRVGQAPGTWQRHLDTAAEPWLADHSLAGQPVLPAAAMLDMALAAGAACHPEAPALEVSGFAILRALPLEAEPARALRCTLDSTGRFTLESRRRLAETDWTLHAEGRVAALSRLPEAWKAARPTAPEQDGAAVRHHAAAAGLEYGPAFHGLAQLVADPAAGIAEAGLVLPAAAPPDAAGFLLHPVRLDAALQGMVALLAEAMAAEPGSGMVPVRVARLVAARGAAPAE